MSERAETPEKYGGPSKDKSKATSAEVVTLAAKVALSAGGASAATALTVGAGAMGGPIAAGVAGLVTLISEALPPVILKQRQERQEAVLVGFAERIAGAVDERLEEKIQSPEFIDLLEDVMGQAQRAMSEPRIGYLAHLLATGFTDEAAGYEQHKKMTELLGQLTDAEVVWLGYYGHYIVEEAYSAKHAAILDPKIAAIDGSEEDHDAAALRTSWITKLERLGLVERPIYPGEEWPSSHEPRITQLGSMMLNHIGMDSWQRRSNRPMDQQCWVIN